MTERSVRTTTELPADADLVWEVVTSPAGVESWLGEGSRLDPREGADLDVADVETGIRRLGRVDEVVPGRRLGFVWWPDGDDPSAGQRVDVVLTPHDGGTTLTVTETRLSARASVLDTPAGAWAWRSAAIELALLRPRIACAGAVV